MKIEKIESYKSMYIYRPIISDWANRGPNYGNLGPRLGWPTGDIQHFSGLTGIQSNRVLAWVKGQWSYVQYMCIFGMDNNDGLVQILGQDRCPRHGWGN